jgi:hypothetical protein
MDLVDTQVPDMMWVNPDNSANVAGSPVIELLWNESHTKLRSLPFAGGTCKQQARAMPPSCDSTLARSTPAADLRRGFVQQAQRGGKNRKQMRFSDLL